MTQELRSTIKPKSPDIANAGVKIKITDDGEIELWLDWLSITFSGKFLNSTLEMNRPKTNLKDILKIKKASSFLVVMIYLLKRLFRKCRTFRRHIGGDHQVISKF